MKHAFPDLLAVGDMTEAELDKRAEELHYLHCDPKVVRHLATLGLADEVELYGPSNTESIDKSIWRVRNNLEVLRLDMQAGERQSYLALLPGSEGAAALVGKIVIQPGQELHLQRVAAAPRIVRHMPVLSSLVELGDNNARVSGWIDPRLTVAESTTMGAYFMAKQLVGSQRPLWAVIPEAANTTDINFYDCLQKAGFRVDGVGYYDDGQSPTEPVAPSALFVA